MKPIMLQGHERSITQIKYNRDGDLIFSCAKDKHPNVWYSLNGERLGTYDGHEGAVWTIDVNWDSTRFMSGAADATLRLWDCETGTQVSCVRNNTSVRSCAFSYSGNLAMYSTDKAMGHNCKIYVVDVRTADNNGTEDTTPVMTIPVDGSKVTSAVWGELDERVISGHENGDVMQWDLWTGKLNITVSDHSKSITDMQLSKDGTMFITSSKDTTAKLFDTDTLKCLKTYKTERPVNSAAISPSMEHVVLGGGQEAMDVTMSSVRVGKFDARFFHLVFEEEFGRVKGHFGPINSVAFNPDGKGYSSGGEDGYVRVHTFDQSYFEYKFDY